MSEALAALVRANLAGGLAILLVLPLRPLARRLFGAQAAYALWLVVPAAFLANLFPAREALSLPEHLPVAAQVSARLTTHLGTLAVALWLAGAAAGALLLAWSQYRFLRAAAQGRAGPAVVGVFAPRMVVRADHQHLYTAEERALIRAHERAHIERGDPRINALIALAQCLNWFNPLAHLAAHFARIDQELACDATVLASRPRARRLYAETLLKTQLPAGALPLGCHWTAHPLERRIAMLGEPPRSVRREIAGCGAVAALAVVAAYCAWIAQPERAPLPQEIYQEPYPAMIVLMVDAAPG